MGVLAMFSSLLIQLLMPILDTSRIRGSQFRSLMRFSFWTFVVCFFILMFIGSQHVESPEIDAAATAYYFSWFVFVVPAIGIIENTLMDIALIEEIGNPAIIESPLIRIAI